ncbi:MAG: NAD(P)-dependent oxidoreductase [Acidobacteriaceae bacterium]|nr:NAD(P)-dependent oxidoreductase [Acidobacteriaceae bacterium]
MTNTTKFEKSETRIGFIGLGLMGSRLVKRLHAAGWKIEAWNRSPEPTDAINRSGIAIAASPATLARESDMILSCLANDVAVRNVYFGKDGVLASAKPGTVVLEMSTISPDLRWKYTARRQSAASACWTWPSQGLHRRSTLGPSPCWPAAKARHSSNAFLSTKRSPGSGS